MQDNQIDPKIVGLAQLTGLSKKLVVNNRHNLSHGTTPTYIELALLYKKNFPLFLFLHSPSSY
jgi:hypothetical protein